MCVCVCRTMKPASFTKTFITALAQECCHKSYALPCCLHQRGHTFSSVYVYSLFCSTRQALMQSRCFSRGLPSKCGFIVCAKTPPAYEYVAVSVWIGVLKTSQLETQPHFQVDEMQIAILGCHSSPRSVKASQSETRPCMPGTKLAREHLHWCPAST